MDCSLPGSAVYGIFPARILPPPLPLSSLISFLSTLSLPPLLPSCLSLVFQTSSIFTWNSKKIISSFIPKRNDKQQHSNHLNLCFWTKKFTYTNTFIPLFFITMYSILLLLLRLISFNQFWFLSLLPSREPHFGHLFLVFPMLSVSGCLVIHSLKFLNGL